MSKTFTATQVSSSKDLIIIDKKVYDVTDYAAKHPFVTPALYAAGRSHLTVFSYSGGDDILEEVLGQDASEAFHEVGHSEDAMKILGELYIGELESAQKVIRLLPLVLCI